VAGWRLIVPTRRQVFEMTASLNPQRGGRLRPYEAAEGFPD